VSAAPDPNPRFAARVAADQVVSLLGGPSAPAVATLLCALRAGWLTRTEAAELAELAAAVAWLCELELPRHRGRAVDARGR